MASRWFLFQYTPPKRCLRIVAEEPHQNNTIKQGTILSPCHSGKHFMSRGPYGFTKAPLDNHPPPPSYVALPPPLPKRKSTPLSRRFGNPKIKIGVSTMTLCCMRCQALRCTCGFWPLPPWPPEKKIHGGNPVSVRGGGGWGETWLKPTPPV